MASSFSCGLAPIGYYDYGGGGSDSCISSGGTVVSLLMYTGSVEVCSLGSFLTGSSAVISLPIHLTPFAEETCLSLQLVFRLDVSLWVLHLGAYLSVWGSPLYCCCVPGPRSYGLVFCTGPRLLCLFFCTGPRSFLPLLFFFREGGLPSRGLVYKGIFAFCCSLAVSSRLVYSVYVTE